MKLHPKDVRADQNIVGSRTCYAAQTTMPPNEMLKDFGQL